MHSILRLVVGTALDFCLPVYTVLQQFLWHEHVGFAVVHSDHLPYMYLHLRSIWFTNNSESYAPLKPYTLSIEGESAFHRFYIQPEVSG